MVDELNNYNVGDKVEVGWSIHAREWNGKWYNNVDLVNIKSLGVQADAPAPAPAPAPAVEPYPANCFEPQSDDLPF